MKQNKRNDEIERYLENREAHRECWSYGKTDGRGVWAEHDEDLYKLSSFVNC